MSLRSISWMGRSTIASACQYFPPRTIHLVIVDPGVGTERRPLLVSGEKQYFIAPDNGVLSIIFGRESCTVRHITAEHYFLNPISPTFHGRDIFAPTAAWLSKAWQTEAFGEEITDYVRFTLPKPKAAGNALKGVVLRVDAFGNMITNFTAEDVPAATVASGEIKLSVNGKEIRKADSNIFAGNSRRAHRGIRLGRLPRDRREPRQRCAHAWRKPRRGSDARPHVILPRFNSARKITAVCPSSSRTRECAGRASRAERLPAS